MANDASELLAGSTAVPAVLSAEDARTHALRRLRLYVSLLRFVRSGGPGQPPSEFRVPLDNVLEEQPDGEKDLRLPAVAFLPGAGAHAAEALGPPILCEDSVGVFGTGTALEQTGSYRETLTVEAWGSHKAERRAILAGLQAALRGQEDSAGIALRLPDYFGQIARFVLDETLYVDDPDVIRGRRRGQLRVSMDVPEVRLVRVVPLRPRIEVAVFDSFECVEFETEVEG